MSLNKMLYCLWLVDDMCILICVMHDIGGNQEEMNGEANSPTDK